MLVKWEGIVIRTIDYGESSKILTLYTREHGKVGIMARGAKKPKSRLAAVSQLFTHGFYLCRFGGQGMAELSQGEILSSYRSLRENLTSTAYAAYMAELLDRLTMDREPNPFLFQLLSLTFRYLDEGRDPEILCRIFESKMLRLAGITPHLHSCANCGKEKEPYSFSVSSGGLLCPDCSSVDPHAISVTAGTWKLLRLFQIFDLQRLGDIQVKDSTRSQLRHVLHRFMDEHLDFRLKSRSFLEQLEKLSF